MTQIIEARTPLAPPRGKEAGLALRWVCTNNPFYAISAGLFLAGLWISFGDPREAEDTWALLSGLVGYTILLAVTACLLVRFVGLWDDARTVLLLVVLMFLATSVTFDRMLIDDVVANKPPWGVSCVLVGLAIALLVSESVLRAIRLVLPALYRGPYYLILSLFFLYPLALPHLVNLRDPHNERVMWGLFGFSPVAGILFLTLLPAVRCGAAYVRENGSPWRWPLYPWALFALLALAVPARAVLLCYSMHLIDVRDLYDTIFGLYFLFPFTLSMAVLLLEMGLVSRRAGFVGAALILPAVSVIAAMLDNHSTAIYQEFLALFTQRLGVGPAYLALMSSGVFYAYTALRGAPRGAEVLTGTLVLIALTGPRGIRFDGFVPFQQIPLLLAAMLQMGLGLWKRDSWHCLIGVLTGVASLILPSESEALTLRVLISSHIVLLATLVIGGYFEDELAMLLRETGSMAGSIACLLAIFIPFSPPPGIPAWSLIVYPLAMSVLLVGYGYVLRHYPSFAYVALIVISWLFASSWQAYRWCREAVAGLDYLVVSLVLFTLAILVSLGKAGVLSRWIAAIRQRRAGSRAETETGD